TGEHELVHLVEGGDRPEPPLLALVREWVDHPPSVAETLLRRLPAHPELGPEGCPAVPLGASGGNRLAHEVGHRCLGRRGPAHDLEVVLLLATVEPGEDRRPQSLGQLRGPALSGHCPGWAATPRAPCRRNRAAARGSTPPTRRPRSPPPGASRRRSHRGPGRSRRRARSCPRRWSPTTTA